MNDECGVTSDEFFELANLCPIQTRIQKKRKKLENQNFSGLSFAFGKYRLV